MKGSRPEQAVLTRDTDLGRTEATRRVVEGMVDGLNDHRIADIGEFFAEGFGWHGHQGCGEKRGLRELPENWQKTVQAAFRAKVCADEARLFMGERAAAFGREEATHAGPFMGTSPPCASSSAGTCSPARAGRPTAGASARRRGRP